MTLGGEGSANAAAETLHEYADRLASLADELDRVEEEVTADEISYQIRDGEVVVIELAYFLSDRTID